MATEKCVCVREREGGRERDGEREREGGRGIGRERDRERERSPKLHMATLHLYTSSCILASNPLRYPTF